MFCRLLGICQYRQLFFFQSLCLFFRCLIPLARTSSTSCLIPSLREKHSFFSPWGIVFFVGAFCQGEVVLLYSFFSESLYHEWLLNLSHAFFFIDTHRHTYTYMYNHVILLKLLVWCTSMISDIELTLYSWNKHFTWS